MNTENANSQTTLSDEMLDNVVGGSLFGDLVKSINRAAVKHAATNQHPTPPTAPTIRFSFYF